MTNSEYFEKNKISFAKAMEIFNKQKSKKGGTKSFDKFLAIEHVETKFKVGDLVVLQQNEETRRRHWYRNVVFEIIGIPESDDYYEVKFLTPSEAYQINDTRTLDIDFLDRNCILY